MRCRSSLLFLSSEWPIRHARRIVSRPHKGRGIISGADDVTGNDRNGWADVIWTEVNSWADVVRATVNRRANVARAQVNRRADITRTQVHSRPHVTRTKVHSRPHVTRGRINRWANDITPDIDPFNLGHAALYSLGRHRCRRCAEIGRSGRMPGNCE